MSQQMDRILKARRHILLDQPFYGFGLMTMELVETDSVKRASTNGKKIFFNPSYIESLTFAQIKTVMLHEWHHVMKKHHLRIQGKNLHTWNEATDYQINNELIYKEKCATIEGIYLDKSYDNMSSEEIYRVVNKKKQDQKKEQEQEKQEQKPEEQEEQEKQEPEDNNEEGNEPEDNNEEGNEPENNQEGSKEEEDEDSGSIGDIMKPDLSETSSSEEENRIEEIVQQSAMFAEKAGKLSDGQKRIADKILKPEIPWQRLLISWINSLANSDYNWYKKDKRIPEFFFPILENEEMGRIGVLIDTSASIDKNLLNVFLSEVKGMRDKLKFNLTIASCDTEIKNVQKYNKKQKINYVPVGGGGTDFTNAFDYFNNNERDMVGLIVFTDMYVRLDHLKTPRYKVLWMNYGYHKTINVPFGKVVRMKGE